jgi:hypothetical protein
VRAESVQTYARIGGVLLLLSFVGGGIGEAYAPSTLVVPGNAAATAHNLLASDMFFRLGFLAYLLESFTDVALTERARRKPLGLSPRGEAGLSVA